MKKVIKEEFEKLESLKISDDSFTCNTSLEIFHNKFIRMSRWNDDLFTYEVEILGLASIQCDLNENDNLEQQMTYGADVDMEYDPSNVEFTEWLASKFYNHKTMDQYTKNALWIYWTRGDDEGELTDEESSDSDNNVEFAEIFRIDANVFDFETPTCRTFKEFNYILQIDPNVLTKDIDRFKTYEEYKDDWIYEWNKDIPWVHENHKQTMEYGRNPLLLNIVVSHSYSRMDIQNGQLVVGKMTDIVMDGKLKDEALKNRAILEGIIVEDDESHNEGWRRWDRYQNTIHDHEEREIEEEHENKERCELFNNPHHETPVCKVRRFEMIKYSIGQDEEYVAIKECEYEDLTITNEDACRAYQEIFRSMDEGWMVTRHE
ncbi:hypothetical protein Tco_0031144 [Tanacetum coccineum]